MLSSLSPYRYISNFAKKEEKRDPNHLYHYITYTRLTPPKMRDFLTPLLKESKE
jgi:hypothetical protein